MKYIKGYHYYILRDKDNIKVHFNDKPYLFYVPSNIKNWSRLSKSHIARVKTQYGKRNLYATDIWNNDGETGYGKQPILKFRKSYNQRDAFVKRGYLAMKQAKKSVTIKINREDIK